MKLIDDATLSRLSSAIAGYRQDQRVLARLELYSCKMAGHDKKMYKQLLGNEGDLGDLEWLSPSALSPPTQSPINRGRVSKKTLYYLKATLNAAYFPDYDFRFAKATEFTVEYSYDFVCRNIETTLLPRLGSDYDEVRSNLFLALEQHIKPSECEIYSYCGDGQSDPWSDSGSMWNFVYFFFNKQAKQILFFACEGLSPTAQLHDGEHMEEFPDEIMFDDPTIYEFDMDRTVSMQSDFSMQ